MDKSRRRLWLIVGIGGFAALMAALTLGYFFRPFLRARAALRDVSALQVGKSTYGDARRILEKWESVPPDCSAAECSWFLWIGNSRLPKWWRGDNGEIFSAGFHVTNGIVDKRGAGFWIGTGPNVSFASVDEQLHWKQEIADSFAGASFLVEPEFGRKTPDYRVYVRLKPDTPADIRSKYLAFDLNCLWKYQGCSNAAQLLPTVEWPEPPQ